MSSEVKMAVDVLNTVMLHQPTRDLMGRVAEASNTIVAALTGAQARIEALEKLMPYVQHRPHCWREVNPIIGSRAPKQMCTCGLDDAKAVLSERN